MAIRKSIGERTFDVFNVLFMTFLMLITLYPLLYVFFASFSRPELIVSHRGFLFAPLGFSLRAYRLVFENPMILIGYRNTLIFVIGGTALNLAMTTLGAYVLSRRNFYIKNFLMFLIVFTMFFNGGLIPSYLLVLSLGMFNTFWGVVIPVVINTFNLIIMRTAFQAIPESLEESAKMDGASHITILLRIILPLSLPVIAVIVLFYGVGHWNSWFREAIYLRSRQKYPLQVILREILIENSTDTMMTGVDSIDKGLISEVIKYATIVVATVPILIIYPLLQKYFVKGVMIGAIKG